MQSQVEANGDSDLLKNCNRHCSVSVTCVVVSALQKLLFRINVLPLSVCQGVYRSLVLVRAEHLFLHKEKTGPTGCRNINLIFSGKSKTLPNTNQNSRVTKY